MGYPRNTKNQKPKKGEEEEGKKGGKPPVKPPVKPPASPPGAARAARVASTKASQVLRNLLGVNLQFKPPAFSTGSKGQFTQTSGQKPFPGAKAQPTSRASIIAEGVTNPKMPGWFYPGRLQELLAGTTPGPDPTKWEPGNAGPGINSSIKMPPQPGSATVQDFLDFYGENPFDVIDKRLRSADMSRWAAARKRGDSGERARPEMFVDIPEAPPMRGEIPAYGSSDSGGGGGWGGGGGGGGGYTPQPQDWFERMYSWRF